MKEENSRFESVYSSKVKAGKRRTYFFDVKETKGGDFYITLTESTKRFQDDTYQRHKIFLYKEDFNRFQNALIDVIDHVKTELLPDFEYDQYEKRQEEWEASQRALAESGESTTPNTSGESDSGSIASDDASDDLSW